MQHTRTIRISTEVGARAWWAHLLWIGGACLLGFTVAALFAGLLALERSIFLLPHGLLTIAFFWAYLRWSGIDIVTLLRRHWLWGLLAAALAGAFLVSNVLSQPVSPHASGAALAFDLLWLGVVYGTVDALLLSVLPILATWRAFASLGWTSNVPGRIAVGAIALVLSLVVTAAYHLGFPEFRGAALTGPVIGNGVGTLAYLLSNNPLGALLSHVAMHVAAVLQGPATTLQLPPHY